MKQWNPVEIEAADIQEGVLYFIAFRNSFPREYAAQGLNGKFRWSIKPGIACRYEGGEALRRELAAKPNLVAVAVPADADQRWRARRKRVW